LGACIAAQQEKVQERDATEDAIIIYSREHKKNLNYFKTQNLIAKKSFTLKKR